MLEGLGNNEVFINKHDVIEIVVNGDQTADSVNAMADRAEALAQDQRNQEKQALVMDNLLKIGKVTPEARRLVIERAKTIGFDKLAMLGNGSMLRFGANMILHAVGKSDKVKYFEDYDEAIEWLTQP